MSAKPEKPVQPVQEHVDSVPTVAAPPQNRFGNLGAMKFDKALVAVAPVEQMVMQEPEIDEGDDLADVLDEVVDDLRGISTGEITPNSFPSAVARIADGLEAVGLMIAAVEAGGGAEGEEYLSEETVDMFRTVFALAGSLLVILSGDKNKALNAARAALPPTGREEFDQVLNALNTVAEHGLHRLEEIAAASATDEGGEETPA